MLSKLGGFAIAIVSVGLLACGNEAAAPPHTDAAASAAAVAIGGDSDGAAGPAAAAGPVSGPGADIDSLLAAVPANTPLVFAALEPLPPALIDRLAVDLLPLFANLVVASGKDGDAETTFAMAALLELGGTVGRAALEAVGFDPAPRFVVYTHGLMPVIRISVRDPDKVRAFLARVAARVGGSGAATRVDGVPVLRWTERGGAAVIGVVGHQLVAIAGPTAVLEAALPAVLHPPAPPTDPAPSAALRAIATRRGFTAHGVGVFRMHAVVETLAGPDGPAYWPDDKPPSGCVAAIASAIGGWPDVELGLTKADADHFELVAAATVAGDAGTPPPRPQTLPGIAVPPGAPSIAFTFNAATADGKKPMAIAAYEAITTACAAADDPARPAQGAAPDGLVGLAVAYYGTSDPPPAPGAPPVDKPLDELYVALAFSDLRAAAKDLREWVPDIDRLTRAPEGKELKVKVPFFGDDTLGRRRGNTIVVGFGPGGKRRVAPALAAAGGDAFFHAQFKPEREDRDRPGHDEAPLAEDLAYLAGSQDAMARLVSRIRFDVAPASDGVEARLALSFRIPVAAGTPLVLPAIAEAAPDCRAVLARSWKLAEPGVTRLAAALGLSGKADTKTTYRTSWSGKDFLNECVMLDAERRRCLLDAADPVEASATCVPPDFVQHVYGISLPRLDAAFDEAELARALQPGAPGAIAPLAGRWADYLRTWRISADGTIAKHSTAGEDDDPVKQTIAAVTATLLEMRTATSSPDLTAFLLDGDHLLIGEPGDLAPLAADGRFVARAGDGYALRDAGGCAVVTGKGRVEPAVCTREDKDGVDTLRVAIIAPCDAASPCGLAYDYQVRGGLLVGDIDTLERK
jgi:hypothetical protein